VTSGAIINIFHEHLLPLQHLSPILKTSGQHAWAALVLIFAVGIVVVLKINATPKLLKIIQSTYNVQVNAQLEREEFNPFRSFSLMLNALYLLSYAFLAYKINRYYQLVYTEHSTFVQFLLFTGIILVVYMLKYTANKLVSVISNEPKLVDEFETNCFIINYAMGIFILPWLILAELSRFNPIVFISGAVVVFVVGVLLKWYRGFLTSVLKQRIGILQILVYFCVLELLPVLVLVKYLIETF
jgi:hypothetical protein